MVRAAPPTNDVKVGAQRLAVASYASIVTAGLVLASSLAGCPIYLGSNDARVSDAGGSDAGGSDASASDASASDASASDAGASDATAASPRPRHPPGA